MTTTNPLEELRRRAWERFDALAVGYTEGWYGGFAKGEKLKVAARDAALVEVCAAHLEPDPVDVAPLAGYEANTTIEHTTLDDLDDYFDPPASKPGAHQWTDIDGRTFSVTGGLFDGSVLVTPPGAGVGQGFIINAATADRVADHLRRCTTWARRQHDSK